MLEGLVNNIIYNVRYLYYIMPGIKAIYMWSYVAT